MKLRARKRGKPRERIVCTNFVSRVSGAEAIITKRLFKFASNNATTGNQGNKTLVNQVETTAVAANGDVKFPLVAAKILSCGIV